VNSGESEDISELAVFDADTREWLPAVFPISSKVVWVVLWVLVARDIASFGAGFLALSHSPDGIFLTTPQRTGDALIQLGAIGDGVGVLLVAAAFALCWVIFVLRGGVDAADIDPMDIRRAHAQLLLCAVLSAAASIGAVLSATGTVLYYGRYDDRWVHVMAPGTFYIGYAVLAGVVTYIVVKLRRSIEPVYFEF